MLNSQQKIQNACQEEMTKFFRNSSSIFDTNVNNGRFNITNGDDGDIWIIVIVAMWVGTLFGQIKGGRHLKSAEFYGSGGARSLMPDTQQQQGMMMIALAADVQKVASVMKKIGNLRRYTRI